VAQNQKAKVKWRFHASNSTFAFFVAQVVGVRRLDRRFVILFVSLANRKRRQAAALQKLLPGFRGDLQSHSLPVAHQFNLVHLSGFHLAQRIGVVVNILHIVAGHLHNLVAGF